jgi:serine phosphatase RsbU (regulator of sigma subunit)
MTGQPEPSDLPIVFISSTSEDLKIYREGARDAALSARFHPEMMESFTVSGARKPLAECLARASEVNVVVVIVAHRYGWVPADQPADDYKNITWLECEAAVQSGIELLAFVLDDKFPWANELREENLLLTAVRNGHATPEMLNTAQRGILRLRDFKTWLNDRGIRALFTTPEDLRGKISDALREWRSRHARFEVPRFDTQRSLDVETFALQRLIIEEHSRNFVGREEVQRELDRFLANHSKGYFIIQGEPGQGKTALASYLAKNRSFVHHFVRRSGSRSDSRLILRSLLAQLIPLIGAEPNIPDTLPELVKGLENLTAKAVLQRDQVLFLIDAIDELPEESIHDFPFFVTEGIPDGAFYVVTCRSCPMADALLNALQQFGVPHQVLTLGPLPSPEAMTILRSRCAKLSEAEIRSIVVASEGNPLYLDAVVEELLRDPNFDLRDLPAGIEGFFQRSVDGFRASSNHLRRDVLGLLTVARKPLSLRELCEITGARQREVAEQAIQPISQFLLQVSESYCFYHARFREFVMRQVFYEGEIQDCHRLIAAWLQKPGSQTKDYYWDSLAFHIFYGGDRGGLVAQIDSQYLREKVLRCGYAVLEDIEFLSTVMLDDDDPMSAPRCAALVEELREVVGGDLIQDTRRTVQSTQFNSFSIPSMVELTSLPVLPNLDLFAGLIPKSDVGADFIEVISFQNRLLIAIGDAPGTGLRGAFAARFVGNLFRRLVGQADEIDLVQILREIDRRVSVQGFFERISMQCVEVNLQDNVITFANAGHPHPVLFSAKRGKCDKLTIRGDCLHGSVIMDGRPAHFEQRRAEFFPGDVLVLFTDGLTEGHRLNSDRYGYRFTKIVEQLAQSDAKAIGEAIFAEWRQHPRDVEYFDDITVLVIAAK